MLPIKVILCVRGLHFKVVHFYSFSIVMVICQNTNFEIIRLMWLLAHWPMTSTGQRGLEPRQGTLSVKGDKVWDAAANVITLTATAPQWPLDLIGKTPSPSFH